MIDLETQIRTKQIQFDMKLEEATAIGRELCRLIDQQEAIQSTRTSALNTKPLRRASRVIRNSGNQK